MLVKGLVFLIVLSALSGRDALPEQARVQVAHLLQDDAGAQATSCWCRDQACTDFFNRPYTLSGCIATCPGIARCVCGRCGDSSMTPSACSCDPE